MYQTIIVPLDGSARSERALPVAVRLAAASGAALELVRVYTSDRRDLEHDPSWDEMFRATVMLDLDRLADAAAEQLGRCVAVHLLDGVPVLATLCEHIETRRDALVVMTTHGRTGITRALLGSVSDGLVRHGPAPVLMLRESSEHVLAAWRLTEGAFRAVVVPLDGTPVAEAAIGHAVALARLTGARLHLVRVVRPMMSMSTFGAVLVQPMPPTEAAKGQFDLALQYLTGVQRRINSNGADFAVTVEVALDDRPSAAIQSSCRKEGADLVVMATHARGPSRMLVPAVADILMVEAVDAMLLVHPTKVGLPAGLKTAPEHSDSPERTFGAPLTVV